MPRVVLSPRTPIPLPEKPTTARLVSDSPSTPIPESDAPKTPVPPVVPAQPPTPYVPGHETPSPSLPTTPRVGLVPITAMPPVTSPDASNLAAVDEEPTDKLPDASS